PPSACTLCPNTSGTSCTPSTVFWNTMKNTVFQIRKIASAEPMPSQPIINGSQTMPEIALKNTTSGLTNSAMPRLSPAMKPATMPVEMPTAAPTNRRNRLASMWTHSSPLFIRSQIAASTSETGGSVDSIGWNTCQPTIHNSSTTANGT